MLTRRCDNTRAFLLFMFFGLFIFLPGETSAKGENLYFAESAPKSSKSPDEGSANDRFLDNQEKMISSPQLESEKNTFEKSTHEKPDIVLTTTLQLSLQDVIANTLKNNIAIAVQQFQSQIRKEEIITQEYITSDYPMIPTEYPDHFTLSSNSC